MERTLHDLTRDRLFAELESAIFIKDLEGRYRFVNAAAARRFDKAVEEILGRRDAELLAPETAQRIMAEDHRVLTEGGPRVFEHTGTADGGLRVWSVEVAPYRDRQGVLRGIVGVARDVTAPRRSEAQAAAEKSALTDNLNECVSALSEIRGWWHKALANTSEVMRQVQTLQNRIADTERRRNSALEASELAHELKQPLLAIQSYAEACLTLAGAGGDGGEVLLAALEDLVGQTYRANEIIRHLRRLESRESAVSAPTDINELVRATLPLVEMEARLWDVEIALELAHTLPPALADAVQIQQVLINLVGNAIEAVSRSTGERRVTIATAPDAAGNVEIAVHDTGPGIAAEVRNHLFEPYVTTKEFGTGLGLAISRVLVQANGGELQSANVAPRGAVFSFTLPTVDSDSDRHAGKQDCQAGQQQ